MTGGSYELRVGKAAEYLVVFDLLMKGYDAFLSDQGLPFDAIVLTKNGPKTIQVKATLGKIEIDGRDPFYRFSLRRGVGAARAFKVNSIDYFAFVALDKPAIAYISAYEIISKGGETYKTCVEFKDREVKNIGRIYPNGTVRRAYGKFIQDYPDIGG